MKKFKYFICIVVIACINLINFSCTSNVCNNEGCDTDTLKCEVDTIPMEVSDIVGIWVSNKSDNFRLVMIIESNHTFAMLGDNNGDTQDFCGTWVEDSYSITLTDYEGIVFNIDKQVLANKNNWKKIE